MTGDLSTLAAIIGDRSTAALIFDNKSDAEETLGALVAKRHIRAAGLYGKDGRLFAQYPDLSKAAFTKGRQPQVHFQRSPPAGGDPPPSRPGQPLG
jgi:hypothetical protein